VEQKTMIELNNLFPKCKMIKPLAITAGLLTKVPPISKKTALKGLYELTKKFPKFTELDFNKDKNEFTLHNKEVNIKKGFFLA
jgi:Holliday junction resolvasome RuvABC DNA-binding subunit